MRRLPVSGEAALLLDTTPEQRAEAQHFLAQAQRIHAMIGLKLAQLDQLREQGTRMTRALSGLPRGSEKSDPVGETAAKLADLEAALLADYHALLEKQTAIRGLIQALPDPLWQAMMEMRYLQGASFPRIAAKLEYDERQIYRFHKKALAHVAVQMREKERRGSQA